MTLWGRIKAAIRNPQSAMLAAGDFFSWKTLFEKQRVGLNGLEPFPRFDKQRLFQWSRESDLAYSCIQKIVEAAQDPDLIVERRTPGQPWEPEPGHPLRQLMMRPNPDMTGAEFLGAWLASEEVSGEFFAEIERDRRGLPIALWPLDPTCIFPAWLVFPNSGMEGWIWRGHGEEVHLLPRDVFHSLRRDPQVSWLPLAPLRVALGSIEADFMQTSFVRAFFRNSGVPSGIIKVKGRSLKDEEAEGIRWRWMRRYGFGGRSQQGPAVFDENAEYERIGSDLSEIEGGILREQNEARICGVFGVPPLLVSAFVGLRNVNQRASAKESQSEFWENKMSPTFKRMRMRLQWTLLPEFEPEEQLLDELVRLNWDMSQVIALQESLAERSSRAREEFRVGALTLNEFRGQLGMPVLPEGDYYVRRSNQIPVTPEVVDAQLAAAALAASQAVSLALAGVRDPQADSGDGDGAEDKRRKVSARKVFIWDGVECGREPTEFERRIDLKQLGDLMAGGSSKVLSVLLPIRESLIADAVSKLRGLDPADFHKLVLDWPTEGRNEIRELLAGVTAQGRAEFLAELRAQGEPQARLIALQVAESERLDTIADAAIARLVSDVQARAVSAAAHFAPLVSRLELPARVEERLREASDGSALRIASEAVNQSLALGREQEAGKWDVAFFEWSALLDKVTCEPCRALDGFTTRNFSEMPVVPLANCAGGFGSCRCSVLPVFDSGGVA